MSNKEDVTVNHEREALLATLKEYAIEISACGEEIETALCNIELSCSTEGTKGAVYREQLMARADNIGNLIKLYRSAGKKYEYAAERLSNGASANEIISALMAYNNFFFDQLDAEKNDSEHLLSLLKNNGTNRTDG